jgi:hypothetical protein
MGNLKTKKKKGMNEMNKTTFKENLQNGVYDTKGLSNNEQAEVYRKFKKDALEAFDLTNSPNSSAIFDFLVAQARVRVYKKRKAELN